MPILEIEGQRVTVGDDFLQLPPEQQQATVEEIAASLKQKGPSKVGVGDVVRSAATGVPIIGGALNKLNAATNAALAPVVEPFLEKGRETLDQPTFGERYSKSLDIQNKRDTKFAAEHPVVDTAAKLVGGVGGMAPAVLAAPKAFGAVGTLAQQMRNAAGSGAAVSAADAVVRGEDVVHATALGGGLGLVAPPIAKGIGAAVRAFRPTPPPVPQNTMKVGGVDVPMRPDQMSGDVAAAAEAEAALRGGKGDRAQAVAQSFDETQAAKIKQASEEMAASLDSTGASARTHPQDAGAKVVDELIDAEARRLASEGAATARTAAEGAALRTGMGGSQEPFAAAETVGAGVGRARDAAVARTRDAYGRVRDEPGAFDPEMVAGLSSDLRARLASGPDGLTVNPQSTPKAHEALGLLDGADGTGLFRNTAPRAPVGPVADAAARAGMPAGAPAGEDAVAALVAKGVNPERARAAVARADAGGGTAVEPPMRGARGALEPHDVVSADGRSVSVVPKVVEARSVKTSADPGYDPALQPRNRARAASDLQITDISRNLNPNRLGASAEADRGAPIIGADGHVESGNGRVLAIRKAYEEGGPAAERYRAWLADQGVDVSKFREPVLVRERATPMTPSERKAFTVAANQPATMSLSAAEKALADSRIVSRETLELIRNPADLGSAENRDFVRAFMQGVPASERAALVTANGELSSEGLTRVRNAVLGKAYGDTPVLTRIAESASDDVKSISNGLVAAAPEWAQLRARIAAGEVPASMDVTGDLVDAVARTARIRGKGVGLAESQAQADAFAAQSPESVALQKLFYGADGKSAAPAAQIGNALRHYAQEAGKVSASPGLDLGLAPVSARDVLKTTAAKAGAPAELAKEIAEAAPAATGPKIGEVGLKEMDAARKRLVTMFGDAKSTAIRTGDRSDLRAMGRIMHEFDQAILDAFEHGRFSGDGAVAAQLLKDARASHSAYRKTFSSRGPGDEIGRSVEKILGRYTDAAATPDEIARLSYGTLNDPGGGKAARVAQRLHTILGASSPEWGAYKQGLVSHLIDTPAGAAPRAPAATAARIEKFLDGPTGKVLADVALTKAERDSLRSYAGSLRASEPVPLDKTNNVAKIVAKIAGRDGNPPATPNDVVNILFSRSGRADSKGVTVALAQTLKRDLSPEGWTAVRQGMWEKLTNAGEGKTPFGPQALSQRLHEFLNESGKGLAQTMFSKAERDQIAQLASVYKQMAPKAGTTNPSGTAWSLARIANKASNNLGAMLGLVHSGLPGAAVGMATERGLRGIANARNAREATRLFYGDQPRRAVSSSRIPIVLSQGAAPQANQ